MNTAPPSLHQRFTVLVVAPDPADVESLESVLRSLGLRVSRATDFHDARRLLGDRPHLLMTQIQLGAYNGLQLVLNARAVHPGIAAIVMSRWSDSVLQRDAEAMGATFVQTPLDQEDLIAAIVRTIANPGPGRAEIVRPPFERRRFQHGRQVERRREVALVLEDALEGYDIYPFQRRFFQ